MKYPDDFTPHRAGADTEGRVSPDLWKDFHQPTLVDRLRDVDWDRIGWWLVYVIGAIGLYYFGATVVAIIAHEGETWSLIGQSLWDAFTKWGAE